MTPHVSWAALLVLMSSWVLHLVSGEVIRWHDHTEPADYIVQSGDTLVLRGQITVVGSLTVATGGQLIVDDNYDCSLHVGNIDVSGEFLIGSQTTPYAKKTEITLACESPFLASDDRRKGVVIRANGTLALFGAKGSTQSWTRLHDTANAGTTCLPLELPRGWDVGDQIVLSSTDFDPRQAEKRTITAITPTCVEIDRPLAYMHYGRISEGVDERGEVALLSRSITFRGCMEADSDKSRTSVVGAHMIVLEQFQRVQIQGVELHNFGQGDQLGRYPIHFHLCGDVAPSDTFLRHNAIHDSNFRAITLHGTQGVRVEDNVAFNITGHAMMLEDGAESGNSIQRNLIVLVTEKLTQVRLGSDAQIALSAFYITNPNNTISGNVVAGVEGSGFWIHTRLEVKGLSSLTGKYAGIRPFKLALGEMRGNVAHGVEIGFKVDSPDLDALDYPQQRYSPSFTYTPNEMPVFRDFVVHHSRQGGWFRMLRVVIDNWVVGDVTEGIQVLTRGDTATNGEGIKTYVTNSRFVGSTANRGNLVTTSEWQFVNYLENRSDSAVDRTDDARMAIKLYDGPMAISNCTFVNWYSQPCLNVINPAIGARQFNSFVMSTAIVATDLVFDRTDVKFYIGDRESDGGKTTTMVDTLGAVSGWNRATLLPHWEFYMAPHCAHNSRWGLACPQRYANLDIVSVDSSTDPTRYGKLKIHRNNVAANPMADVVAGPWLEFMGQYIPASMGWLYHPIISPGASYTIQFEHHTPSHLKLVVSNAQSSDVFRLAVVYPEETQITNVIDQNGQQLTEMHAMDHWECVNCYWFDEISTLLLLTVQQPADETTADPSAMNSPCPPSGCASVEIFAVVPMESGVSDEVAEAVLPLLLVVDGDEEDDREGLDPWLQQRFVNELALFGTADNLDWCKIDDPCLHAMDPGNVKMGILAYHTEMTCTGVGCFSDHCRYCKLTLSVADVAFPQCPFDPNYNTSNAGVPVGGGCAAFASVGNSQVGVEVVEDSTCVAGGGDHGEGCINDQCRYCKTWESEISANYLDCSLVATTTTPAPATTTTAPTWNPSTTPSPTAPTAATPFPPTPWTSQPEPASTSAAISANPATAQTTAQPPAVTPASTPTTSQVPATPSPSYTSACLAGVPRGDVTAGISAIDDLSCKYGGLGCFSLTCRFCKTKESLQASHFLPCARDAIASAVLTGGTTTPPPVIARTTSPTSTASPTSTTSTNKPTVVANDSCWQFVSLGDTAKGLTAVADPSCAYGGLGCLSASCRFCSIQSGSSSPYMPCEDLSSQATSAAPPSFSGSIVSTGGSVDPDDPCRGLVSSGDVATGITALTEFSCAQGGVGCVTDACRYCKTRTTAQSAHLVNCTEFTSSAPSGRGRRLSSRQRTLQTTTAIAAVPSIDACSYAVSLDENVAGVFAFTDWSCATGDEELQPANGTKSRQVGCFSDSCRYCRTPSALEIYTTDSGDDDDGDRVGDFVLCPLYVVSASMGGSPFQEATTLSCATSVSFGDFQKGISAVADGSCSAASSSKQDACFAREPCRYCKYRETRHSASLPVCAFANLTDSSSSSSSASLATANCSDVPQLLDLPDEISAVMEPRCSAASLHLPGCIAFTVCRLCRAEVDAATTTTPTPTLTHLPTCSSLYTAQSIRVAAVARTDAARSMASWHPIIESVIGVACVVALATIFVHKKRQRDQRQHGQRQRQQHQQETHVVPPSRLSQDGRRSSVALLSGGDSAFFVL